MYIYYDKNYNLKEFITDVKAFQSASEVNNLYVYVEDLEDDDYTNATVRYKNYGTIDEKDKQINVSNEFNFDGTEEKEIPFNREQDLLYFKYGKTYKFIKFVIPDEILAENGVVLATIRLITDKTIQPLELLTFNVYNEVVAKDVDISLSQWNYLLKRLYISGKFIKVVEDIGILNNNFEDYNDRDVIFDEAGQNFYLILEINGVKTKRLLLTRSSENSVNTIIVRNDKGKAEIETPVKDEDGSKSIVNIEYVNKVVEDLTLRSDVVDIVGTYQELQSYDTSTLTANDVIKVLQDDTHDNASTYYKWNGTSFDFIGEEGPYYTQTEVDAKLDTKLNKVENTIDTPKAYITTNYAGQTTLSITYKATSNTIPRYSSNGTLEANNPTNDTNVANKAYVDGRMDYVVLSKTKFILNSALDEDDRQLLLDFYNKHYEKTNIPLFAIDANGDVASVRMNDIKYFYFNIFSGKQSPVILSVQPTSPNRTFGLSGGYLHNILGQDAWKDYVYAGIGVKNNKLIITDKNGNQTPGQTPSVIIPPFTLEPDGYYILDTGFKVKHLISESVSALNELIVGSTGYKVYVQQAMDDTNSTFEIRGIKLNDGGSPTFSFYKFRIGEGFGGVVATLDDLANYVSYEMNNVNVAGATKDVAKITPNAIFVENGLVIGGTAESAGLVTRGICGASIPDEKGACVKGELYINYDGNNNYLRKVVLGAVRTGTAIPNCTAYTYTAVRGDEMVNYVKGTAVIKMSNLKSAYVTDSDGNQSAIPYSLLPGDSNIAQFDTNGHLYSNDPSIDTHVTNKKYVDNLYFEHIITVKGNFAYAIINKISKKKTAVTSSIEMLALLNLEVNEVYPCFCGYISGNRVTHCVIYNGEKMLMGWLSPSGEFTATDDVGFVSDLVKPL